MKKIFCMVVAFFIVSCAARPTAPPEPTTPFTGTWREVRNQNKPVRGEKTWTFRADKITIDDGEDTYSGIFTHNEDADPKEIDIYFDGFPVNEGIYRLSGNMLMIKILDTARTRPKKLRYERGYILITCYREKKEGEQEK